MCPSGTTRILRCRTGMLPLLVLLTLGLKAHACVWVAAGSPTRHHQFYSPDEAWLGELDRTDGTVRVYRTRDPFRPLWSTVLGAGGAIHILDTGVVVFVRELWARADEPVVSIARASGTGSWTVGDLGGDLVEPVVREHLDSCSSRASATWLERASIEGDWLVVDPVGGPPRRLSLVE